ncbi:hypothetical protein Sxan_42000 [Streptomyces xanthophaeus]|uniref:Uncharacterized protein n=1 Tax=Streptomyces xanthophaeus TaxID=67385 RepID=A0A919GY53_9ACTN|nr:hypothetical protein Sxan_42000 [Streptomyces xanthophaeus]
MRCGAWGAARAVAGRAADRERGVPRSGCLRRRAYRPGPEGHGPAARLGAELRPGAGPDSGPDTGPARYRGRG